MKVDRELHPAITWHSVLRFMQRALEIQGGERFNALDRDASCAMKAMALCEDAGIDLCVIEAALTTPDLLAGIRSGARYVSMPEYDVRLMVLGGRVVTVKPGVTAKFRRLAVMGKREGRKSAARIRRRNK